MMMNCLMGSPPRRYLWLAVVLALARLVHAQTTTANLTGLSADELIEKLASPKASDRAIAAQRLTERPSAEAFDALYALLRKREETSDVLFQAIWAMQRTGNARAAETIAPLLDHSEGKVRMSAAWALRPPCAGKEMAPALVKALEDKSFDVRLRACESLGEIGDAGTVEALLKRLEDERACVRVEAAKALGLIGASNVADRVAQVTLEDDAQRLAIARALLDLGDERCVDLLSTLTPRRAGSPNSPAAILGFDPRDRPEDWHARFAKRVKARREWIENRRRTLVPQPEGTPEQQAAFWVERLVQQSAPSTYATARMKLMEIGKPAIPLLGEALVQRRGQPYVIAPLLAELGPASAPYLLAALKVIHVRDPAAEALGTLLGNAEVEGSLLKLASSASAEDREAAARVLGRAAAGEERETAFLKLMDDAEPKVRHATLQVFRDAAEPSMLTPKVRAQVVAMTTSTNVQDRMQVAYFCGSHPQDRGFHDLYFRLLRDPDESAILAALQYAGSFPRERVMTLIPELLKHENLAVRLRTADYLIREKDPRGIQAITDILTHGDPQTCRRALEVIAGFGVTETRLAVMPVLLKILRSGSPLRADTIYALGRIGDASVLPEIKELTGDPDEKVAAAARRVVQLLDRRHVSGAPE